MGINRDIAKTADKIRSKKLIIFDFDGVIADSVEIKTEAFADLYRPYGESIVTEVVNYHRAHGGMSRFEKFEHYHRVLIKQPINDTILTELGVEFSRLVLEKVVACAEIPGVGKLSPFPTPKAEP